MEIYVEKFCWLLAGALVTLLILSQKLKVYRRKMYTDGLTGLKNATYIEDFLHTYIAPHTAFILIDIDDFKSFNTKFGYDHADEVISSFAKALQEKFSPQSQVFRFKFGDEFLVVSKNTTAAEALQRLDNFKNADSSAFGFSAGITEYIAGDIKTAVISRLMEALATAKINKNSLIVL